MPLQATSGAASQDAFGGNGAAVVPTYIEDVFSTYLYTGTGASQTITNNIDLSTKGGMVWCKERGTASDHVLTDSTSSSSYLRSNGTNVLVAGGDITGFTSSGFTLANNTGDVNVNNSTNVSWTFRKQPKFFDVVTFTAGTSSNRRISHSLGSAPGMILLKANESRNWYVYHRSLGRGAGAYLNLTNAAFTSANTWGTSDPTSTDFGFDEAGWATSGVTQTAYLFAHDAGGFGLTGTDNVISCGSFTSGASDTFVSLGYEPQFVLWKYVGGTEDWRMFDNMRGVPTGGNDAQLKPNTSGAEDSSFQFINFNSTGFTYEIAGGNPSQTYIYIAIRRGPMKVPTTGTSVFAIDQNTSSPFAMTSGFPVDSWWYGDRSGSSKWFDFDRLRGNFYLQQNTAAAESAFTVKFDNMTGVALTSSNATGYIQYAFRRAPSFMDVVCYTGTGVARTVTHNLGVAPELMIVKSRSAATYGEVYAAPVGNTKYMYTAFDQAATTGTSSWNNTSPTSTNFTVGVDSFVNANGATFVAWLFATCPGVSKVGSYTGTGALQTVNCGFTSGARFVLIKRTDSAGDWWIYDSARGITSGNDPYLFLNSTAAEVTGTNYVDTDSTGFKVTAAAPAGLNASGGTYIFLAIA
jgi:hypothetical protein